jgi:signal peptidase I
VVEFFVGTLIIALLAVTFVAQPYFVPSGSMAETLLGNHVRARCPDCGSTVFVGVDRSGHIAYEATDCRVCGCDSVPTRGFDVSGGDQLVVQKGAFDFRSPRRWEIVVFRGPDEPRENFIKRAVGLPGELIQVRYGDIYINGHIAAKSWDEFLRMAIPVYDQSVAGDRAVHHRRADDGTEEWWFAFHDETGQERPVRDVMGYNPGKNNWERDPIRDYLISADLDWNCSEVRADVAVEVVLAVFPGHELRWIFSGNGKAIQKIETFIDGKRIPDARVECDQPVPVGSGPVRIMVACWDGRITAAIHECRIPVIELDSSMLELASPTIPRPVMFRGWGLDVSNIRIWRDVYYTDSISGGSGTAVREPYQLGSDEFFMMGDNSQLSHDSRAWENIVVRRSQLVGKPIVVHWPLVAWRPWKQARPFQIMDPFRVRFLDDTPEFQLFTKPKMHGPAE